MLNVSYQSECGSDSEASSDYSYTEPTSKRDRIKELILLANRAPLIDIFKHYKIALDQYNRKTTCPFPKHKGGRESTPSFWFYPETNSFWCFGCKTGHSSLDFVSSYEDVSLSKAIQIVLEITAGKESVGNLVSINQVERAQLLLDFSSFIREEILFEQKS